MASRYNPIPGSPLTDADATVDPMGFVNEYVLPDMVLASTSRIYTFDASSCPTKYVVRVIVEAQFPGRDAIIKNTDGTTLYTFGGGFGGVRAVSLHVTGGLFQLLSIYNADVIDAATTSLSGFMSATDKVKLNAMYASGVIKITVADNPYTVPVGIEMISAFADDGDISVVLPDATAHDGRRITIKVNETDDPGTITVTAAAGLVEGSSSYVIIDNNLLLRWATFASDGVDWWIVSSSRAYEADTPYDPPTFMLYLPPATDSLQGVMTAAQYGKLALMYRPKQGTALTDANQTLQPFTDKASEYVQTTALGASRTKTLGTTTVVTGTVVRIVRADTAAFTMPIVNGGGSAGTLFTFGASPTEKQAASFYYNGTDWVLVGFEYLVA